MAEAENPQTQAARIANIESLKQKRKTLKTSLTKLKTAIDSYPIDVDPGLIEAHSFRLNEIWSDLNINHFAILDICKTQAEFEIHQQDFDVTEARVIETRAKLFSTTRAQSTPNATPNQSFNFNAETRPQEVRLPKVDPPTFSGSMQDWMSFHDLFTATIHNNQSLTPAVKLQYLKSSLRGDAARIIQSIQVTDANYNIAWDLLTKRYENKRELVFAHIKRLTNQNVLPSESAHGLRELVDTTNECMRTLKSLKLPTDQWDALVVFLLLQKLDTETRRLWELSLSNNEVPSFKSLISWLEQHAQALTSIASTNSKVPSKSAPKSDPKPNTKSHHSSTSNKEGKMKCTICDGDHPYFRCSKLLSMTPGNRMQLAKERKLCLNCLRPGHFSSQCSSESSCKQCGERHHTFLHFEKSSHNQKPSEQAQPPPQQKVVSTHVADNKSSQVLLATAVVMVRDGFGNLQPCRAFLDSGSQANFVSSSCVKRLKLKSSYIDINISGLASTAIGDTRFYSTLQIHSSTHPKFSFQIDAVNLPKVTGMLPNLPLDSTSWDYISTLKLADPKFDKPGHIDILLGAESLSEIMMEGIRHGPPNTPIAQETKLGWILYGRTSSSSISSVSTPAINSCHAVFSIDLALRRFWELEETPTGKLLTAEEKTCEASFERTHYRTPEGRYVVSLPFRQNNVLGNSYNMALRRFKSLERKLESNPEMRKEYNKFMQEYLDLGHMKLVPASDLDKPDCETFYLPHHCVVKESSKTTRVRVVFDGSAKSSTGYSLNDTLMVGPVVQNDLLSIILRFRLFIIALICDVVKMYRQFLIHPSDVDFQRILWRFSTAELLQVYHCLTVTYGTSSAPYLATRASVQLAEDEKKSLPLAAQALKRDAYVDDVLSGSNSVRGALDLQSQLIEIAKRGGLEFQKWASNSTEVLEALPPEFRGTNSPLTIDVDESVKTLGLRWNPVTDCFNFTVEDISAAKFTKRNILSDIAKIFDPAGWLSCVTVVPKILMQRLWQLELDWDEEVPEVMMEEWKSYRTELKCIEKLNIPRCVTLPNVQHRELHGFSDASEKAYAALVYLRTTDSSNKIKMELLASKTKVAPLKQVTLPRLELCGAVLLTRLITTTATALDISFDGVYAWSDSKTTLDWIRSSPQRWKTFIANRVAEIQDCKPTPEWRHISGKLNPADLASRGIKPSELLGNDFWWNGPSQLHLPDWQAINSENIFSNATPDALQEERKIVSANHSAVDLSLLNRYSSLSVLKRITANILRFFRNSKLPFKDRTFGFISVTELEAALLTLIKVVQQSSFSDEIHCLDAKEEFSKNSKLKSLSPFLDDRGLLRVGGRLRHSQLPYSQKHPLLLPAHGPLTTLIIRNVHLDHLHAGPQLMLQTLRESYWILDGKNQVKLCFKKCVICYRQTAEVSNQLMGDLPSSRVTPSRPFLNCGVDFAGPFLLRAIKGRGQQRYKSYVSLFICFCTRAIHLELVSDLSTAAFIAALKRFVSRRGKPSIIRSDCGTNFIGADRELRELQKLHHSQTHNDIVSHQLSKDGIQWQFNPPSAPHFGGLWEAGVKSTKYHLRRIVGNQVLNFEEMATILCQIEAVLNSRPLCPVSSDPNDYSSLTPGHFLIGSPLTAIPEPNYLDLKQNRLARWQLTQQILQQFWSRWSSEYLSRLQQRPKWLKYQPNIEVNSLILLKDERLPPLQWKLGRVAETHPGSDGKVRVVTVKTADGEYKRPITKICLLPLEASSPSEDHL